jgi:hypothetical protein
MVETLRRKSNGFSEEGRGMIRRTGWAKRDGWEAVARFDEMEG